MTLEERINQMLAESEKEDIMTEDQIDEVSSGIAQHGLSDHEKQSHVSFMKMKYGVDTKFNKGGDRISYHGPQSNVKKAILNHYDGDVKSAKQLHPKLFEDIMTEDQIDELSNNTLHSYVDKAKREKFFVKRQANQDADLADHVRRGIRVDAVNGKNPDPEREILAKKYNRSAKDGFNRADHLQQGIKVAQKKIKKQTQESEDQTVEHVTEDQLDELSNDQDKTAVSDQVSALLEAEGLSEDFKLQAVTIFEAAIADRMIQLKEYMEQEYVQRLEETKAELEDNIDGFMSEAVQQWTIDNKVEIESNFKTKLNESFIDGLQSLLAEHNLELVGGKEDALDVALSQVSELEESVAKVEAEKAALVEEINSLKSAAIMESFRSKMPSTTFDRFVNLTESIKFATPEQYTKQLDIVFTNFAKTPHQVTEDVETVVESKPEQVVESNISAYANYFASKTAR